MCILSVQKLDTICDVYVLGCGNMTEILQLSIHGNNREDIREWIRIPLLEYTTPACDRNERRELVHRASMVHHPQF